MLTALGKKIRQLRLEQDNMTLQEMSGRVGLRPSVISGIENGKKPEPLGFRERVAKCFSISLDELKDFSLYNTGNTVFHVKSGKAYVILHSSDECRTEHDNQPAYVYKGKDGTIWVRSKSEMEDGRFKMIANVLCDDSLSA